MKARMHSPSLRQWAIRWMFATIVTHLVVGMLLPWFADAAVFRDYHRGIETAFWGAGVPPQAHAQQIWWISLFGPTVQSAALWMGALAYIGARQRSAFAWGALIAGMLLWAPQDMLVSLRADCLDNIWIDTFALVTMLPPLVYLFCVDRKQAVRT